MLQADGSLFEMPLSPAEAVRTTPPQEPVSLLDAQFAQNGGSALVSKNPGPHLAPELCIMSFSEDEDVSLEPASLLERFPWSKHPGIWTGLLRDPELAQIKVEARTASIVTDPCAPIHTGSAITALAVGGDQVATGETNGLLTIHRRSRSHLSKMERRHPELPT